MFVSQLEEFLEKGTASPRLGIIATETLNIANNMAIEASKFVDSLFSALRSKSYLPYEPIKDVPDGGIPIPLDALMSSASPSDRARKRSHEEDDHDHPPPKGPRLNNEGHFSRYHGQSRGGADLRGGQMNGRGMGRGEGPSMNGHMRGPMGIDIHHSSPMYRPPGVGFNGRGRRGICRDYHSKSFILVPGAFQLTIGQIMDFVPVDPSVNIVMARMLLFHPCHIPMVQELSTQCKLPHSCQFLAIPLSAESLELHMTLTNRIWRWALETPEVREFRRVMECTIQYQFLPLSFQ